MRLDAWDRWISQLQPLDRLEAGDAEVVLLGELNHFVHEKVDFRLTCARLLRSQGFDAFAEEMGWSDGWRIARYLLTQNESWLARVSLFGYRGDARTDRADALTGVFAAAADRYPSALMRAEHARFLRELSAHAFFGIDVAAGWDGAYADLAEIAPDLKIARLPNESRAEEVARLKTIRASGEAAEAIAALIDGLSYRDLLGDASSYEATRPAMAFREGAMKRRYAAAFDMARGKLVLMAHALHLARNDALIEAAGIGPGGGGACSLGHHIVQELRQRTFAVWMLYGGGEDSQPLPDLPRKARYGERTLNAKLARRFTAPVLLSTRGAPDAPVEIGHMYSAVFRTTLREQADAIYFLPRVTPMRA